MIETRRVERIRAGDPRLIDGEALAANNNRARTRTDARIGIHRKAHRTVATACARCMNPRRSSRRRPTATTGRGQPETAGAASRIIVSGRGG